MKLRKMLAVLVAGVMTVASMAVVASADDAATDAEVTAAPMTTDTATSYQLNSFYQDGEGWSWNAANLYQAFAEDGTNTIEWDLNEIACADTTVVGKLGFQVIYGGEENDFDIGFNVTAADIVKDGTTTSVAGLVGEKTATIAGQWKNATIDTTEFPEGFATTADLKGAKLVITVALTTLPDAAEDEAADEAEDAEAEDAEAEDAEAEDAEAEDAEAEDAEAEDAEAEDAEEATEETEEVAAVDEVADTTTTTGADKANPSTGVEGVVAIAALALVSAGVVAVSRKRK